MNIIYECEICGFRSRNKILVEKCEAIGDKHGLPLGTEVEFWIGYGTLMKGKIVSRIFRKRNHVVSYRIISNDITTPNFCRGRELTVPYKNVRSVSQKVPEK